MTGFMGDVTNVGCIGCGTRWGAGRFQISWIVIFSYVINVLGKMGGPGSKCGQGACIIKTRASFFSVSRREVEQGGKIKFMVIYSDIFLSILLTSSSFFTSMFFDTLFISSSLSPTPYSPCWILSIVSSLINQLILL